MNFYGDQSPKLFSKLFDCQIQPMLTCGSEVWGLVADNIITERIHLFKTLMTVSSRTLNSLVYGETGRYPVYICTYTRCIKSWLNNLRMQEDRIPFKSYKMLYNMHCNNKNNRASCVCFTLCRWIWTGLGKPGCL